MLSARRFQRRSVTVDIDDGLGEGLRRFLRQVMPAFLPGVMSRCAYRLSFLRVELGSDGAVASPSRVMVDTKDDRALTRSLIRSAY
jgi:hypothetical protein